MMEVACLVALVILSNYLVSTKGVGLQMERLGWNILLIIRLKGWIGRIGRLRPQKR